MEIEQSNKREKSENIVEETDNFINKVGLKRQVNLLNGSALLVGSIIGSGIFSTPRIVANSVGSTGAILLTWSGCGVITMCAALSWCELGSMFPNSCGAEYTYILVAFGPIPAFMFLFTTMFIIKPSGLVLVALTCGDYIMDFVGVDHQQEYSKSIATVLIGL